MFQREHLPNLGSKRQEALNRAKTDFRVCAHQPHKLHMPTEGRWAEGLCWLFQCHAEANVESQAHGSVAPTTSGVARSGWLQLQLPPSLLTQSQTGQARQQRLFSGLPARSPRYSRSYHAHLMAGWRHSKAATPCPGVSQVPRHKCPPGLDIYVGGNPGDTPTHTHICAGHR